MSRVIVTAPVTVSGSTYKRGDVIEASAALVTALGANARALPAFAAAASRHDEMGEAVAVANSSP